MSPACQAPANAPDGSCQMSIVPDGPTCIGPSAMAPPFSVTNSDSFCASSVAKYVIQAGGCSVIDMPFTPATFLPPTVAVA